MTKPVEHECPFCGATEGLRITRQNPWTGEIDDVVCEDCFTGMDDGPCFDDLPVLPSVNLLAAVIVKRANDRLGR